MRRASTTHRLARLPMRAVEAVPGRCYVSRWTDDAIIVRDTRPARGRVYEPVEVDFLTGDRARRQVSMFDFTFNWRESEES
jgi:hypothetical protein